QQVVVALEVALAALGAGVFTRVVMCVLHVAAARETFAAVAGFVQCMLLQHGAHRAVQHEDARGQGVIEFFNTVRMQERQILVHGFLASRLSTSKCGERASREMRSQCRTSSPALRAKPVRSSRLKPRFLWPNGATAARCACFASVAANRRPPRLRTRDASAMVCCGCSL